MAVEVVVGILAQSLALLSGRGHIIFTAIAGAVILGTGFARADGLAALVS